MKIAVSGKGGVGKTTVSASLIYLFGQDDFDVFAVDADPDASLGLTLGISSEEMLTLTPLVEMKEVIEQKSGGGGAFYSLNPEVEDVIDDFSIKKGRTKFLLMGGIKQGGSACYCRENSFLNAILNTLLLDKKEVVILDMGAGIEHLTRGTSRSVDLMIVVAEPTRAGVNTALVVQKLARELGLEKIKILGNKIRREEEKELIRQNFSEEDILGFLPYEEKIWAKSMDSNPTNFSEEDLLSGMEEVFQKVLKEVETSVKDH